MNIKLKNGSTVNIELGPLFMEYLEDYDGGIQQLFSDWENKVNTIYIANHLAYAAIASNYNEPIKYRNALKLIGFDEFLKLVDFIGSNIPDLKDNDTQQIGRIKHF